MGDDTPVPGYLRSEHERMEFETRPNAPIFLADDFQTQIFRALFKLQQLPRGGAPNGAMIVDMAAPHPPGEQSLQELEVLESQIPNALNSAGQALAELSRDNPRMKQVENHTNNFLKSLEVLENGLSKHIAYLTQVSTGQAHQGSCYGAYKDVQMAYHRAEHVRSRIQELRNDQHLHQQQQRLGQMAAPVTGSDSLQRGFPIDAQHTGFPHSSEGMSHN